MSDDDASAKILKFRPRPSDIQKMVRALARNSKNVRWRAQTHETHSVSRMNWRDITDVMMFDVLRTGHVKGDIEPGKYPGEWKVKMCKPMKGRREVGVVTLVIKSQWLFVKTVEWED